MKETLGVKVALFSETFGKVVSEMTSAMNAYARREMLAKRGLKPAQIRREVRKRMKSYQIHVEAVLLAREVCERVLKLLREHDPLEKVVETLGETKNRETN